MMMKCEIVREKLGAWLDGELGSAEVDQIKSHVEGCPSCATEEIRLNKIQSSLEKALKLEAATLPFESFWNGVEHKISERTPWHIRLADRFQGFLYPRRLAWAIPIAIVSLLGVLSLNQIFPEWPWGPNRNIRTAVESIDAFGLNVAVFREYDTKTTVIWLFENQDDQEQSSAEPIQDDNPTF